MRDLEKKEAEALGVHLDSIPVSGWSPPSTDRVAQFLSLFDEDSRERVFVHYRLGEDRTGVCVATCRIAAQKWPAEQAIKEMYFFGFNSFGIALWSRSSTNSLLSFLPLPRSPS